MSDPTPIPVPPEQSVLTSTKKLLGLDESYEAFDMDITIFINSAFSVLDQVGAVPLGGYQIKDKTDSWADYFLDVKGAEMVKNYIYIKVRNIFDPPANSFVMQAFEAQAKEIEYRLNMMEWDFSSNGEYSEPTWWKVSDADDFPPEAKIGDLGYDPITNNVWRNVA